jgi:hypothetical protein
MRGSILLASLAGLWLFVHPLLANACDRDDDDATEVEGDDDLVEWVASLEDALPDDVIVPSIASDIDGDVDVDSGDNDLDDD